ncbi:MAG: chorismate mutase [Chloroflexota bacterium]
MRCLGIRGATTVESNNREAILEATRELLGRLIAANGIQPENVACAIFTTTRDLNAEFPAVAARQMGWVEVALLCGHEMDVPNSLQHCLRILVLLNTEKSAQEVTHIYIKGAKNLKAPVDPV